MLSVVIPLNTVTYGGVPVEKIKDNAGFDQAVKKNIYTVCFQRQRSQGANALLQLIRDFNAVLMHFL